MVVVAMVVVVEMIVAVLRFGSSQFSDLILTSITPWPGRLQQKQTAFEDKKRRRKEHLAVFEKQVQVLGRLVEVYETMSAHLPSLCKYVNLLR